MIAERDPLNGPNTPNMPATPNGLDSDTRAAAEPVTLSFDLILDDPEVVREILEVPEGPEREHYLAVAVRLGVLALRQASGVIDSSMMRREGERILEDLDHRMTHQLGDNFTRIADMLQRYFDPTSGDLPQRIERLVRKDGELETMLNRHLGTDDYTIARTLAGHIGENSPIFKLLSPDQSNGVLAALSRSVQDALRQQRDQILQQFSLDDDNSALTRLIRELSGSNGQLRADLAKDLAHVCEEFSLDNESGALSRLVARVEKAQQMIGNEFSLDREDSALSRIASLLHNTNQTVADSLTLDDEASPLYRLRRELLDVVGRISKDNQCFHTEVRETIAALSARREESDRSTRHGCDFEAAVGAVLQSEALRCGDLFEATGGTTGIIPYCKKGDHVLTLGPDSAAADARIVCEAKEDKSYNLRKALEEMDEARRNRQAQVGVFIFSQRCAPEGLEPLFRHGSNIVVIWDRESATTDVYLKAGMSLARALVVRERAESEQSTIDFGAIDLALTRITKDAERVDEIQKLANTVRNNGDKIIQKAERVRNDLEKQVDALREHVDHLQADAK